MTSDATGFGNEEIGVNEKATADELRAVVEGSESVKKSGLERATADELRAVVEGSEGVKWRATPAATATLVRRSNGLSRKTGRSEID